MTRAKQLISRLWHGLLKGWGRYSPATAQYVLSSLAAYSDRFLYWLSLTNEPGHYRVIVSQGALKGSQFQALYWGEYLPVLNNQMERACTDLVAGLPLQNQVVLDIGASYGYYAVLLSKLVKPDGRVYAFEADVSSLLRLGQNLNLNSCENVVVLPYAVAEGISLMQWGFNATTPWSNRLVEDSSTPSTPVLTLNLDALAESEDYARIGFVIIDVEDSEVGVLRGGENLFRTVRPLALIELHSEASAAQVFSQLKTYGYAWRTVEYINEERHHILAFPQEHAATYGEH